eukprot:SAG11_NODE_9277_length_926_cov_1.713422_1_plen_108_part_10
MDEWVETFRGTPPVDAARPVLVPGDPEWAAMSERTTTGIPVPLPHRPSPLWLSAALHLQLHPSSPLLPPNPPPPSPAGRQVKLSVVADLADVSRLSGVPLPVRRPRPP